MKKKHLIVIALLWVSSVDAQTTWTLKQCVDTAFKNNIALNKVRLNSETGKINLEQSKAAILPNLNLTDGHNISSGYSLDPYTYQYTTQNISVNNIALNSSVTLFNGNLLVNTIKQNKLVYEAGMLDVEKTKNDITLNIIAAYMQVLMDKEAIKAAQAQLEATTAQAERTKKFVEFGKTVELNLFQIQSQLASDKLTLVNAENQLQLDKIVLLQLMEIPAVSGFDIESQDLNNLFPEIPSSTEAIEKSAESFLPQVKSAALKTNAALYSLKMAESGWKPKLTLSGSLKTGYSSNRSTITQSTVYHQATIGYLNNDLAMPVIGSIPSTSINKKDEPFSDQMKNNLSKIVGVNLTVPIFNNLQAKSAIANAKINLLNAKLNEQQVKNDIRKSVETAYANQLSAQKKLAAIEEQMALEQRTYNDMEKKYTVGVMDATTFLVEKNNYNRVTQALIQAKYDYVLKTKIVNFYLGKPLL